MCPFDGCFPHVVLALSCRCDGRLYRLCPRIIHTSNDQTDRKAGWSGEPYSMCERGVLCNSLCLLIERAGEFGGDESREIVTISDPACDPDAVQAWGSVFAGHTVEMDREASGGLRGKNVSDDDTGLRRSCEERFGFRIWIELKGDRDGVGWSWHQWIRDRGEEVSGCFEKERGFEWK